MNRSLLVKVFIIANAVGLAALGALLAYVFIFKAHDANDSMLSASPKSGAAQDTAVSAAEAALPRMSMDSVVAVLRNAKAGKSKLLKAIAQLTLHAKNGDEDAMFLLGVVLEQGLAGKRDLHASFNWFEQAAQKGHADAMVKMAQFYADGVWVDRNESETKRWLTRAKAQGSRKAAWLLEQGVTP